MQTVILAGGLGTRLMEETGTIPKPMVRIGDKPIIWHIMKIYSHYGFNDFIICLGYKGHIIKKYFLDYHLHNHDLTIESTENKKIIEFKDEDNFNIRLVDTGLHTFTAGRIRRIKDYIKEDHFFLTYGDGVSDINIHDLYDYHLKNKKIATVSAVFPEERFGRLEIGEDNKVTSLVKKPKDDNYLINGGFFVLNKQVFDYIPDNADHIMWEEEPIQQLIQDQQLNAYRHTGFWKCMDVMRDKIELEKLWDSDHADWKVWQ